VLGINLHAQQLAIPRGTHLVSGHAPAIGKDRAGHYMAVNTYMAAAIHPTTPAWRTK
jgi:hypothetical protein